MATPGNVLGAMLADETGQRVNARQPLVPSGRAATSHLLQMLQEQPDNIRRKLLDQQMINLFFQFLRHEGKQQGERVAIAALRILRKIAIQHHVLKEESANPGARLAVVSQQPPPLQQTLQNADWPAEAVPESSSGTSVYGTSGGGPNRLRVWETSNLHRRRVRRPLRY